MLSVLRALRNQNLPEPRRTHTVALTRRLLAAQGTDTKLEDPAAYAAGLEYLGARVTDPDLQAGHFSSVQRIPEWRMLRVLDALREATAYRAYIGEWIRDGCPAYADEMLGEVGQEELLPDERHELLFRDGELLQ